MTVNAVTSKTKNRLLTCQPYCFFWSCRRSACSSSSSSLSGSKVKRIVLRY